MRGTFAGWRALTIESLLTSGCGQDQEPQRMRQRSFKSSFQCLIVCASLVPRPVTIDSDMGTGNMHTQLENGVCYCLMLRAMNQIWFATVEKFL